MSFTDCSAFTCCTGSRCTQSADYHALACCPHSNSSLHYITCSICSVAPVAIQHCVQGSPIDVDQGKYDKLTFWEQLDDGVQYTGTRKFFTLIPVVLFILATHGTDYRRQPLGLNLGVAIVLLVAKAPALHKVRIFGINKD